MGTQGNSHKNKSWLRDISLTYLGWELALPIFGGIFLGYQADKLFDTHYTFTLFLLMAGIVTGYFNIFKTLELDLLRTKATKLKSQKKDRAS